MPNWHNLMETTVNATLTPHQNDRLREGIERLIEKYGSMNAAAKAIGRDQGWISKLLRGISGGSYQTAALVARELGTSVDELLGVVSAAPTPVALLPGYDLALTEAVRFSGDQYSKLVWDMVGRMIVAPLAAVDAMVLLHLAGLVQMSRDKNLTSSSDLAPASRSARPVRGGHRPSGSKIRKR